ncbi:MAG: hypothetical protein ACYCY9_10825 [Thiobacillus sp.]
MNAQIANISSQITTLRAKWQTLAATGKHADAVGIEIEITALERASARYEIQHDAEQVEAARLRAIDAAGATLAQIEKHRAARGELEGVVSDIEAAAKALEAAMARVAPAWNRCVGTWPRASKFKEDAEQEAYNEALGSEGRYPHYQPLKLATRLPVVLDVFRQFGNGGPGHTLAAADTRF